MHTSIVKQYVFLYIFTEDEDFLSNTQSFTFNTGDPTPCIDITIVQDPDLENCETFDILISTTDSNVFPSPSTATVTIYDDDGMCP